MKGQRKKIINIALAMMILLLSYSAAYCQILDKTQKELYYAIMNNDTIALKASLLNGADPNHKFLDDAILLNPLVLAAGNGSTNTTNILLLNGAKLSKGNEELLTASWFNNVAMMNLLLLKGQSFNDSAKDGLHIISKGLDSSHWKGFCDLLRTMMERDSINSDNLHQYYFLMRIAESDADTMRTLEAIKVYIKIRGLDDDALSALLEDKPQLLDTLSKEFEFQTVLLNLSGCKKLEILQRNLLGNNMQAKRKIILSLKDKDVNDINSCKYGLYTVYLRQIIEQADDKSFWEFEPALDINFLSSLGANTIFGFIMSHPVRESHFEIITHLLDKGYAFKEINEEHINLLQMLCYNQYQGEFRNRLIDYLISKSKGDKNFLSQAYYFAEDELTIRKLVSNGADIHHRLTEKLERLMLLNKVPELSYILENVDIIENIRGLVDQADSSEEIQVLKNFILKRKLVNSELTSIGKPLLTLTQDVFKVLSNSVLYNARVWKQHMHGGTVPTKLFENSPLIIPANKDIFNLATFEKNVRIPDGIYPNYELDFDFSVKSYTAQAPTMYIEGVPIIKKGDKIFNKGALEIMIPKMSFESTSAIFFPTIDVRCNCSGKGEVIKVISNGKEMILNEIATVIIDLSQGDFILNISNLQGWSMSCNISLIANWPVLPSAYKPYANTISSSFLEKERIKNYADLYDNTLYNSNITALKNAQVSTNILSHRMYSEKYPEYVADQLRQSAERITSMDENLNKLRQFYVLNQKITGQNILDLRILFQKIDLKDITDILLKQKLEQLNQLLINHANDGEIVNQYLELFTSQYFRNVNQEISSYQGLILELAQFVSDNQIKEIYDKSKIDVKRLHRIILKDENVITSEDQNGRGKFLRTLISK